MWQKVIKFRIWRGAIIVAYLVGPSVIAKVLRRKSSAEGAVSGRYSLRKTQPAVAGFEDGGRGNELRHVGSF